MMHHDYGDVRPASPGTWERLGRELERTLDDQHAAAVATRRMLLDRLTLKGSLTPEEAQELAEAVDIVRRRRERDGGAA